MTPTQWKVVVIVGALMALTIPGGMFVMGCYMVEIAFTEFEVGHPMFYRYIVFAMFWIVLSTFVTDWMLRDSIQLWCNISSRTGRK
ncbi:hypothetical protein A3A39_03900 [Candidatus Kaiserbacteria bacterium RIFCSPLOWO2_01_FULL_54_13]|uniref:Uncharacterized protein n=1 Tax=Candidatus Kaiserbacteria bacterium RIFCSPLOWO2_01_FULL_54_13 TaxID=1798512 RepID=A0A1F6F0X8_9BACT|nr:MAG: hypothetical protein A3A39_03900 [Candidatus Kaiserbacteria bacterium RIFCSPLOWO2_01_FULL_54_13]